MIGMRPCECWTAMRISSLCSSKLTVGDSPVVPQTEMPSVPSATCQSIRLLKRARSRPQSSRIGVMIATRLPVIMRLSVSAGDFNLPNVTASRAEALNHRRLRPLDVTLLERDGRQAPERLQQLAGLEQKRRVRGPAEFFVAHHKGFVNEHALLGQRAFDRRQERAVQIICNDDRRETLTGERPGATAFEVRLHEAHAGNRLRLAI